MHGRLSALVWLIVGLACQSPATALLYHAPTAPPRGKHDWGTQRPDESMALLWIAVCIALWLAGGFALGTSYSSLRGREGGWAVAGALLSIPAYVVLVVVVTIWRDGW